ncbi:putative E3 ubiquitin-protein ligase HECTD2 [Lamellibrachia satsuma]|nr:putative E3 ubiquitin-protein ligase HECTD2 [Lamellibrachia satsuma]
MAATTTPDIGATTITCPACGVTATQAAGSRRTICPHCGNFYDADAATDVSLRGSNRPVPPPDEASKLPTLKRGKERSTRLQSLANFFQNLGNNRRGSRGEDTDTLRTESQLSQGSPGQATPNELTNSDSQNNSTYRGCFTPRQTQLPPISSRNSGIRGKSVDSPGLDSSIKLLDSQAKTSRPSTSRGRQHEKKHGSAAPSEKSVRSTSIWISKSGTLEDAPLRLKTREQFKVHWDSSKESGCWQTIQEFYANSFNSFADVNDTFKNKNKEYNSIDDPGIDFEFVYEVYNALLESPMDLQKSMLKAFINSLLTDRRPHTKDDLRAYFILLLNPQFHNVLTHVVFAHLLRQIAALPDHDHHFLVHWFKKIKSAKFLQLVQHIQSFISVRLFPPKPEDLPPMSKCTWWIPSATRVLALLNAANNLWNPSLVPYTAFHNSTLDHLDLMSEYYAWQNPASSPGFSFCQYPFILSLAAKREILQRDSEQQMIVMARRSLVAKVQRRQLPDIGMLFLNITVRRSHLVSDSLNEIARKQHDLKKKLKVTFSGEPGLDMGGLTKEWFLLLVRQIFQQDYGMFIYDKRAHTYWFSSAPCESYQEFNLVGVLMGLAVYNSIILDIRFPPCCFRKLLSPAVVPYDNPSAIVGVASLTLNDLRLVQPDIARGLKELLEYEGNVEDDFGLTFQISYTEFGETKTASLSSDGTDDGSSVTNDNRKDYVQRYVNFLLNQCIYNQFKAFYHGFHSVCASNALIVSINTVQMLSATSVSLLV